MSASTAPCSISSLSTLDWVTLFRLWFPVRQAVWPNLTLPQFVHYVSECARVGYLFIGRDGAGHIDYFLVAVRSGRTLFVDAVIGNMAHWHATKAQHLAGITEIHFERRGRARRHKLLTH